MTDVNSLNMKTRMENERIGGKLSVAFDVDDTLLIPSVVTGAGVDLPNHANIAILRWFKKNGHDVYVWSGGGVPYAERWVRELKLGVPVIPKEVNPNIDICFDDCDVLLAKVNVKVKRIGNKISRKDWNKHDTI